MNDTVIEVEHLSKCYRLGERLGGGHRYETLRDGIANLFKRSGKKSIKRDISGDMPSPEYIWALREVSFQVERGDVLGIIGRNGAGKTTILKILSRITEPTDGTAVINGRVGSLLEVGTGFHPELTGRENTYLSGAILGMKKREINRKFDEIVAFAELDKFMDTPVKFYSSGMYVRLAFAVAAHLEPEILLVDEVLAVGDVAFQKKCLDKMGDISGSGRTVLFVSHNMNAILALCSKGMYLETGKFVQLGTPQEMVTAYLDSLLTLADVDLAERTDREGNGTARIVSFALSDGCGKPLSHAISGKTLKISLEYKSRFSIAEPSFALAVYTSTGIPVFHCNSRVTGAELGSVPLRGTAICTIPRLPLPSGTYWVNLSLRDHGTLLDRIRSAAKLEVQEGNFFGTAKTVPASWGMCLVDNKWEVSKELQKRPL